MALQILSTISPLLRNRAGFTRRWTRIIVSRRLVFRFNCLIDITNRLTRKRKTQILVKDLSISIGTRELLSHAKFQLQPGRHYVLHGRNGIGKSTLLRAIAADRIPSIPRGVKVLLLGQTQSNNNDNHFERDFENLDLAARPDETVLQHVVRSDQKREYLLSESKILTAALENSDDPLAPVKAYRKLSHERLEQRVAEARQIALRRSGARGAKARSVLLQSEAELKSSESTLREEITPSHMSEDSQKAAEMLAEVQSALELVSR